MVRTIRKKLIYLFLFLIILSFTFTELKLTNITVSAYSVSAPTSEAEVKSRLNSIANGIYGDGSYFPYVDTCVPAELAGEDGGYTCFGYARYVFYQTFGLPAPVQNWAWNSTTGRDPSMLALDAWFGNYVQEIACWYSSSWEDCYNNIHKARSGDWIQVALGEYGHSMILLSYDGDREQVVVLDCNIYYDSYVHVRTISFSDFANRYGSKGVRIYRSVNYPAIEPMNIPTQVYDHNDRQYVVGETISLSWTPSSDQSGLHHYWVAVTDTSGNTVQGFDAQKVNSTTLTINTPGIYYVHVFADDLGGSPLESIEEVTITETSHIHEWGEWTYYPMSEAAPACRMRTCKICSEVQSEDIICDGVNHALEKREAVEATCTQIGRIEFWICSLCNLKFADANGTTPINDVTAPIKEHNWGEWITSPATEAAEAHRTRTCKTCGEVQTEVIICDGKNHTLEKREAVEATCTQTGRIEFWICSLCNLKFADANGTTLINDVTAPIKEHNWGEWITYPATEAAEAYRTRNCKTCGEVQTEVLVCDGKNHTLEKRESIEATCTETGRIEFWVCSLCNMKFADVNGNKPINDITVPAKGHNWNNGVVTKPATTTSAGVKTFTCTVCGETKTESISKLPNSGSGASSGSGSSSSRRPSITSSSTTAETVIVNGLSKTWAETVTTIDSTAINGIVTISGSTDTPSNVIAAAAKKNVKLEVRVNDTFTWVIDAAKMDEGSKYLSVSDSAITATNKTIKSIEYSKDFRITESKLGTGSTLRYNAGSTNSGKFANLFKVDGSNLIFVGVSMADTAGNALLPITTAGTYKIVTSNETKLVGDLNNSMNLNALDAAIMLKKLVNGNIPAEEVAKFDFNGDGNANALDAATILKYILNK